MLPKFQPTFGAYINLLQRRFSPVPPVDPILLEFHGVVFRACRITVPKDLFLFLRHDAPNFLGIYSRARRPLLLGLARASDFISVIEINPDELTESVEGLQFSGPSLVLRTPVTWAVAEK